MGIRTLSFLISVLVTLAAAAGPMGSAFTYSGRLTDPASSNQPVTGQFEFQFQLYTTPTDGKPSASVIVAPVGVTNGLVSTVVDFGSQPFDWLVELWLDVGYRKSGSQDPFILFNPRQKLTAVPYASSSLSAGTAHALSLTGAFQVPGAGVGSGTPAFVHQAAAGNISSHITTIDNPYCNGNPGAILLVTHNWTQDGAPTRYETAPVGVYYDSGAGKWTIFHEDLSAMPEGRAYNVLVIKP
jgi:hypothetical protein